MLQDLWKIKDEENTAQNCYGNVVKGILVLWMAGSPGNFTSMV